MPDQRLTCQVGLGDLLLAGQPVTGGQHHHERLGVERSHAQAGLVDRQPHIADVDAAVEQHRGLVVPFDPLHVHDHVRMPGLERPGSRDDRNAGPEADHQPPAATGRHGHPATDRVRGGEQRTGVGQQLSAGVGQRYAVAIPGEQQGAEILLQRPDLAAERRLRDMQLIGGAAEVQPVGHGDEVAQFAQVQIHGASRPGDASKVSPRLKEDLDTHSSQWHR